MKKKYSTNLPAAKKTLGQNFLINQGVLDKIVTASELKLSDIIVEIGPGRGTLTEQLAKNSDQVIAVEKDHRLIDQLKDKFINTNVKILEEDILEFKPETHNIKTGKYKIIGNIPYYLTSHLLKIILEDWPKPQLVILMVQKEVAQRIMSKPPNMNLLALSVQFYCEPKIISYVSKGSFRPIPKVDSAIIKLVPHQEFRIIDQESRDQFFKLIKTAFAGKRKQLQNTLLETNFESLGINPKSRPEELSLEDWVRIAENSRK